ncbi:hypothetical protein RFI_29246 [Reticulomyxa filosa]|uniref:Uncharacterized protein n=1 Tax=Reticulomyxa filosa TaxID=46433 RepID=X6M529_RETFI|nr:hypothetical protein RFI_29246 [Reticulomyxa filosa]|eukprot:ETO08140.1 hypothetical protein RFI_29246 [Reticulomyxa filosa]
MGNCLSGKQTRDQHISSITYASNIPKGDVQSPQSEPTFNEQSVKTDKETELTKTKDQQQSENESNYITGSEFGPEAVKIVSGFWLEHIKNLSNEKKMVTQCDKKREAQTNTQKKKNHNNNHKTGNSKSVRCKTFPKKIFFFFSVCQRTIYKKKKKMYIQIDELILAVQQSTGAVLQVRLANLGELYHSFGIRSTSYNRFLQALHLTFEDCCADHRVYSLRIKYCFESIFTTAAKVITRKDISALFGDRVLDFWSLEFLDSFDICLAHPTGKYFFF